jgi:hypothetical protein
LYYSYYYTTARCSTSCARSPPPTGGACASWRTWWGLYSCRVQLTLMLKARLVPGSWFAEETSMIDGKLSVRHVYHVPSVFSSFCRTPSGGVAALSPSAGKRPSSAASYPSASSSGPRGPRREAIFAPSERRDIWTACRWATSTSRPSSPTRWACARPPVALYKLNPVDPSLESAWFQPFNL